MAWRFLMNTYIPGTEIAFGVMFVSVAMIGIGFRFLSLALGYSLGDVGDIVVPYRLGTQLELPPHSYRLRISDGRKNDTR